MMVQTVEAKVTHRFAASAERVFDAWLRPDMVRAWMRLPFPGLGPLDVRRVEIEPRVGGKFTFSDMRENGEAVHWGYYLEINRPRRLVFSWFTSEADEAENNSIVTLAIDALESGCEATIVHRIDVKWAAYIKQAETGWGGMLAQIDAFLRTSPAEQMNVAEVEARAHEGG